MTYDPKAELIDEALSSVLSKVEPQAQKNAETLFRQFYANFDHGDIKAFTSSSLVHTFLSLWDLLQTRKPDEYKCRLYRWKPGKQEKESERLVIDVVNKNMPFIVDSIAGLLERHGLRADMMLHPVISVQRDQKHNMVDVMPATVGKNSSGNYESIIHCVIKDTISPTQISQIEKELPQVLQSIVHATSDWMAMRGKCAETITYLNNTQHGGTIEAREEIIEFIQWMEDGHFTFLGFCEYDFTKKSTSIGNVIPKSTLGIMKDDGLSPLDAVFEGIEKNPSAKKHILYPSPILINKASKVSTVHRSTPMDTIGIRKIDEKGTVVGMHFFIGLFTSEAYDSSARDIPLLRQKVGQIVQRAGFSREWHDGKALVHILDSLPRDELFQATEEELTEIGLSVIEIQSRQRLAMFLRRDQFNRYFSCLIYIPRDRFDYDLVERVRTILEADMRSPVSLVKAQFGSFSLALAHYKIDITNETNMDINHGLLEQKLIECARSWSDTLKLVLDANLNEWDSSLIMKKYGKAFSKSYEERFHAHDGFADIKYIEKALPNRTKEAYVYRPTNTDPKKLKLKIFSPGGPLPLSDILPVLENLDLNVMSEIPFEVKPKDHDISVWVHDFEMESRGDCPIDLDNAKAKFVETLYKIWSGETEDDPFNRLVIRAELSWRECVLFQGYSRYLRQIGTHFSENYMAVALITNPGITRLIAELFEARFSPSNPSPQNEKRLLDGIEQALNHVDNADNDRILRHFVNLVRSTIRTNYFQKSETGGIKPYISFKIDSSRVDDLPLPRPMFEIFVFSPEMEAIHLRGGKVARGGIRWSDRKEDYRTEILGLMKAQMVKNTVIVPVGSKGGFIVKKDLSTLPREQQMEHAVHCYKTMMRGLLDITDNLVNGDVVPPQEVVRHDEDDSYLVVAADKGTATFSDYANGVSAEYNFWLQDAFASGGSDGYDHKKMGITARGAWESVRQHFQDMDINVDKESVTTLGIGDMSGDVFGNGMLLSKPLKLVLAFNHQHIFIDPDPDPESSYKERKRLFKLPKSNWMDYDQSLISKGGGIFDRKAKSVDLSPEIMAFLDLEESTLTPNQLIQAVLRAQVDLIWFGGIGTYIKSKYESHADAGDRVNDSVRVNAAELRAKVIGEGANLGITQLGRIEFARNGGQLNTDAIDNSAGVDCSDHEVNIKILMNRLVEEKKITLAERNKILEEMTDNVASLVLRDNQLQNQAITLIKSQGMGLSDQQANLMRALEKIGLLNRDIEYLPDDTTLAEYQKSNISLTRPEVSVLLSYAKLKIYADILETKLVDDPYFESRLISYFPDLIQQRYREDILTHPLRREIIATIAINTVVNRMGASFVNEMIEKTSCLVEDVLKAYFIVQDIFGLRDLWFKAENLHEHIGAKNQLSVTISIWRLVRRAVLWMLRSNLDKLDLVKTSEIFTKGVAEMEPCLEATLDEESKTSLEEGIKAYSDLGLTPQFSQKLASLGIMSSFPDIILIANEVRLPVKEAAGLYFRIGHAFGFTYLRQAIDTLKSSSSWHRLALMSMTEDLYNYQGELTIHILSHGKAKKMPSKGNGENILKDWVKVNKRAALRIEQLLNEIKATGNVDFAQLTVMTRELRLLSHN